MTYLWPLDPGIPISVVDGIVRGFGSAPGGYNPPGGHTGDDFAAPLDTLAVAAGDGVIKHAGWFATTDGSDNEWLLTSWGGNTVVLDCGPVAFIYAHLDSMAVTVGQAVKAGDPIGRTGNTSSIPGGVGYHLHFEALPDGWDVNNGTYGRVDPSRYCTAYWDTITTTAEGAATVATNQEKLDAIYDAIFNGGSSMPEGIPLKDLIKNHFTDLETAVGKIPTTAPAVTLTDAQVSAIAKQVAADLPATDEAAVAAAVVKALGTKLSA